MIREISHVMVLAAGRGRRLQPLSDFLPKPAMPLPDGVLVSWAFRLASRISRRIVLNTWWLAEEMEQTARRVLPAGMVLEISREEKQMETAGGLALAMRINNLLAAPGVELAYLTRTLVPLSATDTPLSTPAWVRLAHTPHSTPGGGSSSGADGARKHTLTLAARIEGIKNDPKMAERVA